MSIIIRLQNLPLEANSLDIRRFFQGLHIPDGGVHIVGGENGDAFIAFGGDEDARQAMERNGNTIKTSRIKLLLSSRNEMQRVIDNARTLGMANSVPNGGIPAGGPGPQGPQPNVQVYQQQGHPGQYSQSIPPPVVQNSVPKPPINSGPSQYGQMYPGPQGPPVQSTSNSGYGMPPQQQQPPPMKGPIPSDPFQRPPPFRSRSRSRSPPPPRMHRDIPNEPISSQGPPMSTMQSGLMGSLQQAPPPAQSQQQQPIFSQNGSYGPNTGTNGVPPQTQGSFDNSNYYSRQQYPQNGPQMDGPKFGGQDDRWNGQGPQSQGNAVQPGMNTPGQMAPQQDSYQNQMYRNQSMPPPVQSQQSGPYHQQPPQQQQSQFPTGQMYPNEPTGMPMPQSGQGPPPMQHQQQPPRMFTLQVWNLPLNGRTLDLVNFFAPLYLLEENIKILNDERGFPTGMALVRFPSSREFETALNYNGKFLLDRQIQIRPLDDVNNGTNNAAPNSAPQQQQHQQQQQQPMPPAHSEPFMDPNYQPGYRNSPGPTPDLPYTNNRGPGGAGQPFSGPPPQARQGPNKELAVYMKGLPFTNCTLRDVEQFFQPIQLANIEIERDPRTQKPSGNAFVEFENRQDYKRGMEYNMRHMGRRYIELIPLAKMDKNGPRGGGHHGGPPGPMFDGNDRNGPPPPVPTFCISVKGLSSNITSQDLKMYFGNNGARPYAVHIMLTPSQMNAGEAFLEFVDKELQKRALKRDGDFLGNDRITIRSVPYEIVMGALHRPMPGSGPIGGDGGASSQEFFREGKGRSREKPRGGGGPPPPPFQDRGAILIAYDCSSKAKDEDFCVFFEKFKITPDRIRRCINDNGSIDAQISFLSKMDAEQARRSMDNLYFLNRNMRLDFL